jgi:UPF0716 family protein affecting phage T7 exclusion
MLERIVLFFGGLLLIDPGLLTDIIGAVVLVAVIAEQLVQKRRQKSNMHNA